MQRPTVVALLFVLVVSGYALAGFAVVGVASGAVGGGPAGAAETVTVAGQVTDEDGQPVADAYVLLEPTPTEHLADALEGDRTIDGMLLRFGMADVDGVTVAKTDEEGRFTASVPADEYAVIAVAENPRAVSELHTVEATGDETTVDLQVDPHRVVSVDLDVPGRVAPGETATITVALDNPDDRPVESLSMDLGLPDGWAVEAVETDGEWDADARRFHWDSVPAGERVEATLTVRVPGDAERGSYSVELTGDSESHFVEYAGYTTVDVLPPGATPTETQTPHHDEFTPSPTHEGAGSDDSTAGPAADGSATDAPASAPGFGFVVAIFVLALLAARRR